MTREKEIRQASIEYTIKNRPMCIGGGAFSEVIDEMNRNYAFEEGAKWADEHPNLYNDEKYHTVKVSCLDELNRKAALYDTLLEKACEYLSETLMDNRDNFGYNIVSSFDTITLNEYIEDFKKAMKKHHDTPTINQL
jgi:hypothetical protein